MKKKINEINNKIINNIESINKLIQDFKELNNYINTYFNNIIKTLTEYIYIYHIIYDLLKNLTDYQNIKNIENLKK